VRAQELDIPRSSLVVSTKIFWGGKGVNDRGLSRKVPPPTAQDVCLGRWLCMHMLRAVLAVPGALTRACATAAHHRGHQGAPWSDAAHWWYQWFLKLHGHNPRLFCYCLGVLVSLGCCRRR